MSGKDHFMFFISPPTFNCFTTKTLVGGGKTTWTCRFQKYKIMKTYFRMDVPSSSFFWSACDFTITHSMFNRYSNLLSSLFPEWIFIIQKRSDLWNYILKKSFSLNHEKKLLKIKCHKVTTVNGYFQNFLMFTFKI